MLPLRQAAGLSGGVANRSRRPIYLLSIIEGRKYLSKKTEVTEQKKENKTTKLEISEKDRRAFLTTLKIGFYKEFHKQGILSDEELEYLINLQTEYSA